MLKEFIYDWKTKKALKKAINRNTISFNEAKNIGFLFDNDENYKQSKLLIENLTKAGKTISFLIKSDQKEAEGTNYFLKSDFKWYGKIENQKIIQFINKPFDYLFLLNENPHYLSEYILASSNAKCRVGIYNEDKKVFFELMFDNKSKEPYSTFYKTIETYLKQIK